MASRVVLCSTCEGHRRVAVGVGSPETDECPDCGGAGGIEVSTCDRCGDETSGGDVCLACALPAAEATHG